MSTSSNERPCPICAEPAHADHFPFCSARCRQIDLNRWLSDGYAIAGDPAEDGSDLRERDDASESDYTTLTKQ